MASPIFGATDWYVDSESGKDTNSGRTPEEAKKTLAAALSEENLGAGDTVHVAAGTYAEGVMTYSEQNPMRSRAIVPSNVTLLADEGPEKTIIVGEADGSVAANRYGCGSAAIRCVSLHNNATLTGFTLTGGHTDSDNANSGWGGGVTAVGDNDTSASTRRVWDCVISNNVAWRGGGAQRVSLRRCRIIGNMGVDGSANGSGTYFCEHYGCITMNQRTTFCVLYPTIFCDSTMIETNSTHGFYLSDNGSCTLRNSILAGPVRIRQGGTAITLAQNTIFGKADNYLTENAIGEGCVVLDGDYSNLQFDADGRPKIGANIAIDAGNQSLLITTASIYTIDGKQYDPLGGQRIYNGKLDIGALEADWRPAYTSILGAEGLSVQSADPMVVTGIVSSVCIPTGMVSIVWENKRAPKSVPLTYCVEVTGNGTLTATIDGATTTYASSDGALKLTRTASKAATDLYFTYIPGEGDTGCAVLSGFERGVAGTTFIIR